MQVKHDQLVEVVKAFDGLDAVAFDPESLEVEILLKALDLFETDELEDH